MKYTNIEQNSKPNGTRQQAKMYYLHHSSWPFPQRDKNGDIIIPPKPIPIREEALF